MELEREQNDLLIIAHESVLRVLYGYLMACNATDIPALSFPRNEIIEIIPASYNNEATRIAIPGIEEVLIPPSPEDIKIPVPPSGTITPSTCIYAEDLTFESILTVGNVISGLKYTQDRLKLAACAKWVTTQWFGNSCRAWRWTASPS